MTFKIQTYGCLVLYVLYLAALALTHSPSIMPLSFAIGAAFGHSAVMWFIHGGEEWYSWGR